jgi:hypothetical protein
MIDRVFDLCFSARFGGSGSLLCHSSFSRFGVDWHGDRILCDECWRMKLSESELIARKCGFAMPAARAVAWDCRARRRLSQEWLRACRSHVPLHGSRLVKRALSLHWCPIRSTWRATSRFMKIRSV